MQTVKSHQTWATKANLVGVLVTTVTKGGVKYIAMRRAGRVNLLLLGIVIAVIFMVIFFVAGRNSPAETASSYMTALSKGDVDTLVNLTYPRNKSKEELHKEYEFATQQAGKYYVFLWRIKDDKIASDDTASVQLSVRRNANQVSSYEENFELPMLKKDGHWYVDVPGINAEMYPALPR